MINRLPDQRPVPAIGPIDTSPITVTPPAQDLDAIWRSVAIDLRTRGGDVHVPISMAYAERLCAAYPAVNSELVRVAVLLHDTGWARVDYDRIFSEGFAPGGITSNIRYEHEAQSCEIAREVLPPLGYSEEFVEAVCTIIDGHDTRPEPKSFEDALMKDADRLWRFDPCGVALGSSWFGISPAEYLHRLREEVFMLFTEAGVEMGATHLQRTSALLLGDVLRDAQKPSANHD